MGQGVSRRVTRRANGNVFFIFFIHSLDRILQSLFGFILFYCVGGDGVDIRVRAMFGGKDGASNLFADHNIFM
jgi:hypothetical protein